MRQNRAITIPHQAIALLAQRLAHAVAHELQDRLNEKGMEVQGSTMLGDLCRGAYLAEMDGPANVAVLVETRAGAPSGYPATAGGHYSCPEYGRPSGGQIVVFLNEYTELHQLLSPRDWGIDQEILRVLVHEYTHARDPGIKRLCKGLRKEYPQGPSTAYYNDPAEVKATSAQAIQDVLPLVAEWRSTGLLPRSFFTPKRGGVNAVVREILGRSLQLSLRMDAMTPRNQARVMRDLYRALEDEGLLDEPKKNPAGAFVSGEYWYFDGNLMEVEDHEQDAWRIIDDHELECDAASAIECLLMAGGVRVYDGMRDGRVGVTGLDVWKLDKTTIYMLQDVLMALKRTGKHEVNVDVTSTFSDESGEMEHLYLTAADVLEATSVQELRAQGTVIRENPSYLDVVKKEMVGSYGAATTEDPNESGFLLADGTWLKMGMYGSRGDDHRTVTGHVRGKLLQEVYQGDRWNALVRWMQVTGSIRWMPENCSFDIHVKPTAEQIDKMWRMVRACEETEIEQTRGKKNEQRIYTPPERDEMVAWIREFWR
jgi:hypothetical protein